MRRSFDFAGKSSARIRQGARQAPKGIAGKPIASRRVKLRGSQYPTTERSILGSLSSPSSSRTSRSFKRKPCASRSVRKTPLAFDRSFGATALRWCRPIGLRRGRPSIVGASTNRISRLVVSGPVQFRARANRNANRGPPQATSRDKAPFKDGALRLKNRQQRRADRTDSFLSQTNERSPHCYLERFLA